MTREGFKQVTKDEFYKHIYENNMDVHPYIQPGPYPYTSHWKKPSGYGDVLLISTESEYFIKA